MTIAGPGLERTDQAQLGATKRAYGFDKTWCTLLILYLWRRLDGIVAWTLEPCEGGPLIPSCDYFLRVLTFEISAQFCTCKQKFY